MPLRDDDILSSLKKKKPRYEDQLAMGQDGSSQKSGRRTVKFEMYNEELGAGGSDGDDVNFDEPLKSPSQKPSALQLSDQYQASSGSFM